MIDYIVPALISLGFLYATGVVRLPAGKLITPRTIRRVDVKREDMEWKKPDIYTSKYHRPRMGVDGASHAPRN